MPSTMSFCPVCGGLQGSDPKVSGRRCNCSSGGGVATSSVAGAKVCCVCGTTVTDKKRMKDSATGRYWCYDCFVAEERKKTRGGMTMRCPRCQKDYPPLRMVKHSEVYWCEVCDAEQQKGRKKKPAQNGVGESGAPAETSAGKTPKLIALFVGLLVAAAAYYYFMLM